MQYDNQQSAGRQYNPGVVLKNGASLPMPQPLHVRIAVDEFDGEYFLTGDTDAHSCIFGSCRGGAGYLHVFLAPQDENRKYARLLTHEAVLTLRSLGAKKLRVHVSSPAALSLLADEFGKECLGKPYKEVENRLQQFGSEEVRVQLRP